ncbi:MAG: hypothetical protein ACLQU1_27510 [Bryobacteraceae bacterium]
MRARTLFLCGLVACARAQPTPGELLQQVSKKVLATVDRLPKYMCTQTIDRWQFEPAPGRAEPPCEPALHKQTHLTTSDRLRLDVAVSAAHEMYSWVGESRFDDRSLFDLVQTGALSTGSFSSFLLVIFRIDNTAFAYKGPVTEAGRQLEEFEFQVPKEMSHYIYNGAGSRVTTGYYGTILVDPKTIDLVRLEVHTEGLPPETGSCQSSSTLDYTRLRLNDTDFLLPKRAELYILTDNGVEMKNTTVYSGCHEFLGESTLRFESAPEPGPAGAAKVAAAELPAGIPFQVEFIKSIDPASAAAGDKITAKLTDPIRDTNRQILVPRGAAVTARILQIRRYYGQTPILRLVLKLETVEIARAPRPLAAEPDTRVAPVANRPGTPGSRTLPPRPNPVMVDNEDRQAAVFQFANARGNLVVVSGFESKWLTVARAP